MHDHDAPPPPEVAAQIDLWVSDFLDRPASADVAIPFEGGAAEVLGTFLAAACHGGRALGELTPHDVAHALLDHLPGLSLAPPARQAIPALVAAFLTDLQDVGRLADGRALAGQVRAAAPAFRERAAGHGPDLRRPGPKVGRNDPCPCGSGRKYKVCCLRLLG